MPRTTYDAVVATRNRAEALSLTLPIVLSQTRKPSRLIVVDASDNHAEAAAAVEAVRRNAGSETEVIFEPSRPGLPHQRNRGLAFVQSPVVMFFDDDSVLYPNAAEEILAVYERDTEARIAGVSGIEAMSPPSGVDLGYNIAEQHQREAQFRRLRNRIERRLTALKPALFLGSELNRHHKVPAWLSELDAVPVEYMTGFRMTFRTEAIRGLGFDEALGGYALDEDIDASFTAMRSGLVVGARRAKIYHHRYPGGRPDPYRLGRMTVLNRAHVLLKHASGPLGSAAIMNAVWRRHLIFSTLKLASCARGLIDPQRRPRLAGGWDGNLASLRLWYTPTRERATNLTVRSTS